MTVYSLELKKHINTLMKFFMNSQIHLLAKERRGNFVALLCNVNIWYSFFMMSALLFLVSQGYNSAHVKAAQAWPSFVILQVSTRGINSIVRSEEILSLFAWYQQTYETHANESYQEIFAKYQERQNNYVKMVIKYHPMLLFVSCSMYMTQSYLTGSGALPTPLCWYGIPDDEVARWMYWTYFSTLGYCCFTVFRSTLAIDSFFAVSVILLAYRFKAMGDIMNLLNYEGERDFEKDREIIRDCYEMHLDLLE